MGLEERKKGKERVVNYSYFLLLLIFIGSCSVTGNYKVHRSNNVRTDGQSTVFVDFKDSLGKRVHICWVTVDNDKKYKVVDTTGINLILPPGKHKFEALCFMYLEEKTKVIELNAGDSVALIFNMHLDTRPLH